MSKIAERLTGRFAYDTDIERTILTVREGEDYDLLTNLLYKVAKEMDDDTAYDEVSNALDAIAEHGIECIEIDYYDYCDPDIYTRDLLEWVSKSLNNVAWCDEAMSEGRAGDHDSIVDILMAGQAMAKEYVWRTVIGFAQKLEEEEA